ncbi:MAG: GNAT family N-acetyltransferase [bacterium]|nr:GNAT family N-acetyltransferase [bacterium]
MEIRAPYPNELDEMLELMCRAFNLDIEPARDIFYSDPFFDLLERRVLVDAGRIISCLTIVPGVVVLGAAHIPVAGIAGVATDEAFRRRGYAGALLRDTIRLLYEKKVPLSMLYPFSPRYYRKFGWETASVEWWCEIPSRLLPPYSESRFVRPYRTGDMEHLRRLHDVHLQNTAGSFVREPSRWQWVLRQKYQTVVADFHGAIEGYMIYEVQAGRNRVEVREVIFTTSRAHRALLGFLSSANLAGTVGVCSPVYRVQQWSTWLTDNEDDLLSQVQGGLRPTYMLRITHLPALIECLRPRWRNWQGAIRLVVDDSFVPGGKHQALLVADGVDKPAQATDWARGNIHVWSQIVGGYLSPAEAFSTGLITLSQPEIVEVLEDLFPKYYPFTTLAERF